MPSLLRIVGALLGLLLVWLAVRRLRRAGSGSRVPATGLLVVGLGLIAIAAVPDLVRPIQDILGLSGEPLGRLVTVLVVSVTIAYLLVFYALARADRANQRVSRLVRALSIAQVETSRLGWRAARRRARVHPGVRRGRQPAGRPGRDPGRGRRAADPRARDRRRLARRDGRRSPGPMAPTSSATRSTAARAPPSRLATWSPSGSASTSSSPSTPTASTTRPRWSRLVEPIVAGTADFVVGSRRMGDYEKESVARDAGISLYTRLINLLGGTEVSDIANGYRAIRASRLSEIVFTEDQFHNPELLLGAARAGLRVVDVPVTIRKRASGESKKGTNLRYGLGFLRVIFKTWLR